MIGSDGRINELMDPKTSIERLTTIAEEIVAEYSVETTAELESMIISLMGKYVQKIIESEPKFYDQLSGRSINRAYVSAKKFYEKLLAAIGDRINAIEPNIQKIFFHECAELVLPGARRYDENLAKEFFCSPEEYLRKFYETGTFADCLDAIKLLLLLDRKAAIEMANQLLGSGIRGFLRSVRTERGYARLRLMGIEHGDETARKKAIRDSEDKLEDFTRKQRRIILRHMLMSICTETDPKVAIPRAGLISSYSTDQVGSGKLIALVELRDLLVIGRKAIKNFNGTPDQLKVLKDTLANAYRNVYGATKKGKGIVAITDGVLSSGVPKPPKTGVFRVKNSRIASFCS